MYNSSGATIRGDINSIVEEAALADRFFIGHLVMPELGVDSKSGSYPRLNKTAGETMKPGSTIRNPKSSYGRIERAWESDTYDTIDRGLEELVDDVDRKDVARFFDAEAVAAKLVLRAMRLDHEIRVQQLIQNPANFPATAASVAYTAANLALGTINFPADILSAIERSAGLAEEANTIVMSPNVYARVKQTALFQNFVRGSRPSDSTLNMTTGGITNAFAENGITNVLVGRARYDSAKKGQTAALLPIWNDTYIWVGSVQSGEFGNGGAGRTIVWNAEGGLFVTETYREEVHRSDVVRVRQNTAEKVINVNAGTLITTSYA